MLDYRNILRVSSDPDKSIRTMELELRSSHHTIRKVQEATQKAGISWPLPDTVTNEMLMELLFPEEYQKTALYVIPDYAHIHAELARKGTNLTILWEEYCSKCSAEGTVPYMYTQYCEKYRQWARVTKATMRIQHKPGDAMEVDWAGYTLDIHDPVTGEVSKAYVFDEIDKVSHDRNRASVEDELLSITDESCCDVYDNYLETTLVGLEHCPMFMTANDLQKVSPILADRCAVIHFPNANAARIKSISRKYADKKLASDLYSIIKFDYDLMDKHIDNLVSHDVTSLRKHQQMIEAVLENALNIALIQDTEEVVAVTEDMFAEAEIAVLGAVKHRVGF